MTEPGRGGRQGAGRAPAGKAKAAQKREEPGSRFIGLAAVVFRVALLVLVFVLVCHWGMAGSAWATGAAQPARQWDRARFAEIAVRLNLTEPAVKMAVQRLRARYREILRAEIAHTVSSAEVVEEEIRLLFASFGP